MSPVSTPPPTIHGQTNGTTKDVTKKEADAKTVTEEIATKEKKREKKDKKRKSAEVTVCSPANYSLIRS
jgi:hypothetical protein